MAALQMNSGFGSFKDHDMNVARLLAIGIASAMFAANMAQLAKAQTAPSQAAASDITPTEETGGAWSWIKKPSFTMPKVAFPKMPADPLAPIKNSAKKVGDGTKKAWEGTKEMFSFGGSKQEDAGTRVASAGEAPSMWQRMFGQEEKKDEGPATVGEWMNQKRVE
jgi:hypothetical protein